MSKKNVSKPKSKESSKKPLDESELEQVSGGVSAAIPPIATTQKVSSTIKAPTDVAAATGIKVLTGLNE
jgi:bacteriocin-like protein